MSSKKTKETTKQKIKLTYLMGWEIKHWIESRYIEIRNSRPMTKEEKQAQGPYCGNREYTIAKSAAIVIKVAKQRASKSYSGKVTPEHYNIEFSQAGSSNWTVEETETFPLVVKQAIKYLEAVEVLLQ